MNTVQSDVEFFKIKHQFKLMPIVIIKSSTGRRDINILFDLTETEVQQNTDHGSGPDHDFTVVTAEGSMGVHHGHVIVRDGSLEIKWDTASENVIERLIRVIHANIRPRFTESGGVQTATKPGAT